MASPDMVTDHMVIYKVCALNVNPWLCFVITRSLIISGMNLHAIRLYILELDYILL